MFDEDAFSEEEEHLCDVCHENEAIIFIKIISEDGVEEEKALCANCAVKYLEHRDEISELSLMDERLVEVIEEMKDLLAGIVANISAISVFMSRQDENKEKACPYCGYSFEAFKETGSVGCPYCYQSFKEQIDDFVFEMQRGGKHNGKMPKNFAGLYVLKKEIQFLKGRLQRLVAGEKYEEAEKVKKRLTKLIGNYTTGNGHEMD